MNRRNSVDSSNISETAFSDTGSSSSLTSIAPEPEDLRESEAAATRLTRSGRAFGLMQSRKSRLRQEAIDDPDMEVEDEDDDGEDDEMNKSSFEPGECDMRNQPELCRGRPLHCYLGVTHPAFARRTRANVRISWSRSRWYQVAVGQSLNRLGESPQDIYSDDPKRNELRVSDGYSATSSQATARPRSSRPQGVIHAIGSNVHVPGKVTPVLLRDHYHASDPATPPLSDEVRHANGEAELNFDLSELGLEDSMIKPEQLVKLERIGSGGFKE